MDTVVPIEKALDRVGFGLYSCLLLVLTGMVIISFACVMYNTSILIPISACELHTTNAQQGLLAAMPTVGVILGALFWGYLADTHGRRRMLLLSLLIGAVLNAVGSFSPNWILLLIIQFITSLLVAGQYSIAMTLLSESVPMEKRNLAVVLVTSIFLFSQGIMAAIAIPLAPLGFSKHMPLLNIRWTPWRAILFIYSIPSLISFGWLYCMQESPKYALMKNNEAHAMEILKAIHKVNHFMSKKEFEVTGLTQSTEKQTDNQTAWERMKPLFKQPLRNKLILLTTLYTLQLMWPFKVWLPTIANKFMSIVETGEGSDLTLCRITDLSLKTKSQVLCNLNTIALTLVFLLCGVQSLANLLLSPLIKYVGRRNMVITITSVCGICGIFVNVIPNAAVSTTLFTIQLIGMIGIGYYTAIAVSLFPTNVRATGVTIAITGNRLSMFVAIQVLNYFLKHYCELGFFIFCALFTSSSLLALLLPDETKGPRTSQ